ncbi:MAG: hypothetical protein C7B46_16635 [Sulfobacillus benefaciens]|uniref:Uncharacterized protein n=1 Tax=Sulfobacillus benefaciens TaxID=453960 RepID=A0A2T2XAS5_9FIRM|nr:MAG: hypothetical protein C7B46_16635 [Sulfobacillus benefaciens]
MAKQHADNEGQSRQNDRQPRTHAKFEAVFERVEALINTCKPLIDGHEAVGDTAFQRSKAVIHAQTFIVKSLVYIVVELLNLVADQHRLCDQI